MNTEVFRFTAIRPPQQADTEKITNTIIPLFNTGEETDFVSRLRGARKVGAEEMVKVANDFFQTGKVIQSPSDLPESFTNWNDYLLSRERVEQTTALKDNVKNIFGSESSTIIVL